MIFVPTTQRGERNRAQRRTKKNKDTVSFGRITIKAFTATIIDEKAYFRTK